MRKGFTIGETMVATLILGIVLAAVMTTFLSAQRMLATSMAESELALASRGLREKLLFHAAPAVDGVHYAGMLSGTNSSWVVETGSHNILMQMGRRVAFCQRTHPELGSVCGLALAPKRLAR